MRQAVRLDTRGLLVLVDGGGSSLLLNKAVARIGRLRQNADVDIAVPADIDARHADIVFDGEDYFLLAYGPVRVNHRPVQRTLLRDGDRLTLGASTKLSFHRPSTRSETAVLKLGSRCRLPQDVSQIVLFRDTLLVGPHASSHIRTRDGETRAVIFQRQGRLLVRADHGGAAGPRAGEPVVEGRTLELGDIRITVKGFEEMGRVLG